jgi:signal transduction histidine kinase
MISDVVSGPTLTRLRHAADPWLTPLGTAIAYYAGAQAAFLIGTLSDRIFAPFWPPNAILFCILLLTPQSRWWAIIAAAFPAHALAEVQVGMPFLQLAFAFVTNCVLAVANAVALRWLSEPPWFGSIKKAAIYIAATAGVIPAIVGIGGGFVPNLGGAALADYPYFWSTWFVGNALASLTLGPIILSWADLQWSMLRSIAWNRHLEAALFAVALLATCMASLELSVEILDDSFGNAFVPAVLYLPMPVILWGSVRFGERGASGAILVLTVVSISLTLNGQSPFITERPERSVLAMQLFLFGVAIPVLLLSAAVDELRAAERSTRKLAGAVLRAQDDERRRIARDLHDSTAQNLVGAGLLARSIAGGVPASARVTFRKIEDALDQSIEELRLLSFVLHPPQLELGGLAPAIAAYVEGFSERSRVAVDLAVSPDVGRLSDEAELALYRVLQEALTNVDRHSGSSTALVRLSKRRLAPGNVVRLSIEDAGRGFALRRRPPLRGGGLGLASMYERVHQVGGRLTITSVAGKTVVAATVPCESGQSWRRAREIPEFGQSAD